MGMSRWMRHILLLGLVTAAPLRARSAPDVTVSTTALVTEGAATGRLIEFSLDKGLRLELPDSGETLAFPADEVISVQIHDDERPARAASDRVEIQLSGGDRVFGRPVGADGDRVEIDNRILGRITIPLERIDRWSIVATREGDRGGETMRGETEEPPQQEDALLLSNGDLLRGTVLSIDEIGFTLESDTGTARIPHERVASADLVAEAPPAAKGIRARVKLIDGTRISTGELVYSIDGFALNPFSGDKVACLPERVARIDVSGGKWIWISDLDAISVQHTPMFSLDRPHLQDANVLGGPLRIAERSFDRGLGVHSQSSLLFELAGQYCDFVTWLGVDDAGGPLSDVTAEIRVDGMTAFRKENVRKGQVWGPIRIDVRGAGRIELLALFGENASIQDVFDWAGAGLIR